MLLSTRLRLSICFINHLLHILLFIKHLRLVKHPWSISYALRWWWWSNFYSRSSVFSLLTSPHLLIPCHPLVSPNPILWSICQGYTYIHCISSLYVSGVSVCVVRIRIVKRGECDGGLSSGGGTTEWTNEWLKKRQYRRTMWHVSPTNSGGLWRRWMEQKEEQQLLLCHGCDINCEI